jgi:hypothetical protein
LSYISSFDEFQQLLSSMKHCDSNNAGQTQDPIVCFNVEGERICILKSSTNYASHSFPLLFVPVLVITADCNNEEKIKINLSNIN